MQLYKPNSYGAKQSNFSEYKHQEQHMSQSSYANLSGYDSLAPEHVLAHPVGDFDAYKSHHARANKSINHYAHAQQALPSPSIQVQQGHHMMGKMKRHESHVGQDWASNSPKWSPKGQDWASNSPEYSPALGDHSERSMHNEKHMMGGMENGWASKPKQYSSPALAYPPSQFAYKGQEHKGYDYGDGEIESDCDSEATVLPNPTYLNPIKTSQSSLMTNKGGHMMGGIDNGWANSSPKYSSPTRAQNLGLATQTEGHMMGKTNMGHKEGHMMRGVDQGWANSSPRYSSPTQAPNMGLGLHEEDHTMGTRNMGHKDMHIRGKMDHGWANSSPKYSTPTQGQNMGLAMHEEEGTMGKTNMGWANSPTQYSTPNHLNGSNNAMHREHGQHEWGSKSINGLRPTQANYSAHKSYGDYDQCVDGDVHEIMDEILTKYPSHNVSGGHGSGWAAKPNTSASRSMVGGYAKQQAYGSSGQYGGAAQSMARSSSSSNFEMKKQMNAGYGQREEFSARSSSNKFEAKSMMNKGGLYNDRIY